MRPISLLFILLVSWLPWLPTAGPPAVSAALPQLQEDCAATYARLTANEGWMESLVDPVIVSPETIVDRQQLYTAVHHCLQDEPEAAPGGLYKLQYLFEYFLIFTAGWGTAEDASSLQLVSLDSTEDPAVVALRDEVGLPPPVGYIYVRFYPSREVMPPLVRRAFENESVKGVTILTRYIAVLEESELLAPHQALQQITLPKTVSHELVHAYINSSLGASYSGRTPTWYDEGLASYFSGSGEEHTVVMLDYTVTSTSPEEYRQYEANFDYLEAKHGRKQFLELIKRSVEMHDPTLLYQGLEIDNVETLAVRAEDWKNQKLMLRIGLLGGLALVVGWRLLKLAPQVRCQQCNHSGRRADFSGGVCPNCRRWYNSSRPGSIIGPVRPDDRVRVQMTAMLKDGRVIESSESRPPLTFVVSELKPALASAMEGMYMGDTTTVEVPAAQAFGPYDQEKILIIDRSQLPLDLPVASDQPITFQRETGEPVMGRVIHSSANSVRIDTNHPLAGQDLTYHVKLIEIL